MLSGRISPMWDAGTFSKNSSRVLDGEGERLRVPVDRDH
jgi:hypothetical protein